MSDGIKEPSPIQTFTCEICMEPALLTNKFSHDTTCVHDICFMCIASHIQAKIDENIATINCPDLECGKTLDPLECRSMITSTLFVKWCDCLCKSSISMLKCNYCPNPNCSELIVNECDETTAKCTCLGCKRPFCYTCRVPWHAGFRCSDSGKKRNANDVRFGLLLERMKWTRCPNCGQSIELVAGCNYVRCRCGTRFCYKCGLNHHFTLCRGETLHIGLDAWIFILVCVCILATVYIESRGN